MKIIIAGAGQVGSTLAENLANEANDVTIIDIDAERLRELQDQMDIRCVAGMASHPDVLTRAGIQDADMLIAVTSSDEVNIVTCQVAYSLFHTPTKIARVRARNYTTQSIQEKLFNENNIPVDVLINPEQLATDYIRRLVEHPGTLQVLDFADGVVQLVGVRAYHGGPLVGNELRFLHEHIPNINTRVAAIYRQDRSIIPRGDTVIEAGDEVFFIAAREDIREVMGELRRIEKSYSRIMIVGGGNVGYRLAKVLENNYNVKVIEQSAERCQFLSEQLEKAVVLQGLATNQDLLLDENIDNTDVLLALTNDDKVNIMSSLLAKKLGAQRVMTLINNPVYADLMQGGVIDIAISPQQATTSSLLSYVRRGDTVNAHSLRRGAAEALEIIAHGDVNNSKVIGRAIEDIKSPPGVTIGAVVRDGKVLIAHRKLVIENNDHVIVFLVDKSRTREIEKLFQVGFTFF